MLDIQFVREAERNYPGIVQKTTPQFLEEAAIIVQGAAKRLVRKDTGNLAGSITREVFADRAEVGTNVDYAEHQEYLPEPRGRPYMRPAIDRNRKKLIKRLADLVRTEIGKRGQSISEEWPSVSETGDR